MTRDFNKEEREDSRPSSRNAPSNRNGEYSNRNGEEHSSRQPRPRLNRETVDSAWEKGAPQPHADYHPRSSGGSNPRNNWQHNNQRPGYSQQRGPTNNGPYENRQNQDSRNNTGSPMRPYNSNNQGPRGRFEGNQGPRGGSFNTNSNTSRYQSDDQHFSNRRGYNDEPNRGNSRPNFNDRTQPQQGRGPQPRYQGNSRPGFNNGAPQSQNRGPYSRDQNEYRGRRGVERNSYPDNRDRDSRRDNFNGRNNNNRDEERPYRPPNPRELSRPWVQREQREAHRDRENAQQFEGDYERFDARSEKRGPRDSHPPFQRDNQYNSGPSDRDNRYNSDQPRHVTPLPDGRVLKGPRPVQRKNAEFWKNIAEDTESLVEQVHVPEVLPSDSDNMDEEAVQLQEQRHNPDTEHEQTELQTGEALTTADTRPKRMPAVVRQRKEGIVKKLRPTGGSGLKPSKRGFKWPTT